MLKNPLRWARDRKQPVWKRALKRVAVILLVISLAFGSLMVVSPTARATFIRWVTEWYETHVTYRYAGDDMVGDLPEYTITELPEGYAEDRDQRIEFGTHSVPIIVNGCEGQIFLSKNLETTRNAVTWIDIEQNIQFTIQARLSTDDLLHMAESVSLDNLPEIE